MLQSLYDDSTKGTDKDDSYTDLLKLILDVSKYWAWHVKFNTSLEK